MFLKLFEYTRLPFGLRNSPSTFQHFTDNVLSDLPFIFAYLCDILVFTSDDRLEHARCLDLLFQRLEKYGLTINIEKSVFAASEVVFVGHRVTPRGFTPTTKRIE